MENVADNVKTCSAPGRLDYSLLKKKMKITFKGSNENIARNLSLVRRHFYFLIIK